MFNQLILNRLPISLLLHTDAVILYKYLLLKLDGKFEKYIYNAYDGVCVLDALRFGTGISDVIFFFPYVLLRTTYVLST